MRLLARPAQVCRALASWYAGKALLEVDARDGFAHAAHHDDVKRGAGRGFFAPVSCLDRDGARPRDLGASMPDRRARERRWANSSPTRCCMLASGGPSSRRRPAGCGFTARWPEPVLPSRGTYSRSAHQEPTHACASPLKATGPGGSAGTDGRRARRIDSRRRSTFGRSPVSPSSRHRRRACVSSPRRRRRRGRCRSRCVRRGIAISLSPREPASFCLVDGVHRRAHCRQATPPASLARAARSATA